LGVQSGRRRRAKLRDDVIPPVAPGLRRQRVIKAIESVLSMQIDFSVGTATARSNGAPRHRARHSGRGGAWVSDVDGDIGHYEEPPAILAYEVGRWRPADPSRFTRVQPQVSTRVRRIPVSPAANQPTMRRLPSRAERSLDTTLGPVGQSRVEHALPAIVAPPARRCQKTVDDKVSDLAAEVFTGGLVEPEMLSGEDAAQRRFLGGR
jgi:hypothetical protein